MDNSFHMYSAYRSYFEIFYFVLGKRENGVVCAHSMVLSDHTMAAVQDVPDSILSCN